MTEAPARQCLVAQRVQVAPLSRAQAMASGPATARSRHHEIMPPQDHATAR